MSLTNCPTLIPLNPDNFTHNMWGGDWISRMKSMPSGPAPVGESWEFSGHPRHPSRLKLLDGKVISLPQLIRQNPRIILGRMKQPSGPSFVPFLVKFIDAHDDLSLQVHPPNSYARQHENDSGKSETWLVLSCGSRQDEGFIYLGFNPAYARQFRTPNAFKASFRNALQLANNMGPHLKASIRQEAASLILPYLNKIPVKPRQVYHLVPGTPHAIGRGVQLLEIQQSSDLTYRVWDWNRPDPHTSTRQRLVPRRMHIKKAFDVLNFMPQKSENFLKRSRPISGSKKNGCQEEILIVNKVGGYAAHRVVFNKKSGVVTMRTHGHFMVLTTIEGDVAVYGEVGQGRKEWSRLKKGRTMLIPAFVSHVRVQNESKRSVIIRSFPIG